MEVMEKSCTWSTPPATLKYISSSQRNKYLEVSHYPIDSMSVQKLFEEKTRKNYVLMWILNVKFEDEVQKFRSVHTQNIIVFILVLYGNRMDCIHCLHKPGDRTTRTLPNLNSEVSK